MTALSAPYRLLRRDGDAGVSRAAPPGPAVAPPTAPDTSSAPLLSPSDIARVIAERHFAVAFQPVVRLADREQVGHEALLRLRPPPGMPTLPTLTFVEAAQACGLGATLDQAVLAMVLADWPAGAATCVSVNVSARSLQDQAFFSRLLNHAAGHSGTIAVEITGIVRDDLPTLANLVPALRCSGVHVALDDFSTSDLALATARTVRFDEVKFAGAVVGEAAAGPRGRKLLQALVALAGTIGARTVAKLVETEPQAALMRELGVDCGQGWLFGAPVALDPDRGEPVRPARQGGYRPNFLQRSGRTGRNASSPGTVASSL